MEEARSISLRSASGTGRTRTEQRTKNEEREREPIDEERRTKNEERRTCFYSLRRASIGSTAAARAAGTNAATAPVIAITPHAPATISGIPAARRRPHCPASARRRTRRPNPGPGPASPTAARRKTMPITSRAPRAERDPHADLTPPLRDHVRQHAVQPGHRQQQRDRRKAAHQHCLKSYRGHHRGR